MKQIKLTIEIGNKIHIIENMELIQLIDEHKDRRFCPDEYIFEFSEGKTDLKLCVNWKVGGSLFKELI